MRCSLYAAAGFHRVASPHLRARGREKVVALALALTAVVVSSAAARPATVHDLQPLSAVPHPDACTPPGDIESDTRIAVNPKNANNIVASWNGFAPGGTVLGVSKDGGQTWKQVVVPGHGGCSGADELESFAADPSLAFDADGKTLYVASLNRTGSAADERVVVSRFSDGGGTWQDTKDVPGVFTEGLVNNHLSWLAADPNVPGRAYLVWTSYREDSHTAAFSQTSNGGETWSPATIIYSLPVEKRIEVRHYTLRVLPDGSLLVVFMQTRGYDNERFEILAIRCEQRCEGGVGSWKPKPPVLVGTACNSSPPRSQPRDPDTGYPVFNPPEPSLDVAGGVAYVAWHTIGRCEEHPRSRVLVARSPDGGRTWSAPQDVKREVENVCRVDGLDHPDQAHEPMIAVAPDGTAGVTYYDFRNDCPGDAELTTDVWFAHSHGGGAFEDTHAAGPFNARTLFDPINPACTNCFAVTDFNGLAALPLSAGSNLPDLRPTNMRATDRGVREGEKVTITATVANVGNADAAASTTEFVLDGSTVLGRLTVEPLPAGGFAASFVQTLPAAGTACVTLGCTLEPPMDIFFTRLKAGGSVQAGVNWDTRGVKGEHAIQAIADKDGAVAESDEGNNAATLTITVRGNKIENQSFEQASEDGKQPAAWGSSSTGAGAARWTTGGSDGTMSASVTGNGGSALVAGSPTWTSAPIPVDGAEAFTLRVSVSSVGASSAPSAGLLYLDALGQAIGTATVIGAPLNTDGFVALESRVKLPPGVSQVRVLLTGFSPLDRLTAGTVTFDDIGLFAD
jgi:hypothetical protein